MRAPPKSFRSATAAPARIVLDAGGTLPCIVRNLSAGGAQIEVAADAVVPDRFRIEASDLSIATEAGVVWRKGLLIGIRFQERQAAAASRVTEGRSSAAPKSIDIAAITGSGGRSLAAK